MRIAALGPDDVHDAVRLHIALQHVTYAHLADAGHAAALWESYEERVATLTADLAEAAQAADQDREPTSRHVIARSERGALVGVALAFRGVADWERALFTDRWADSGASWCLDTLHLAPGVRGTGLGQRLLDAALPEGRDAYLWVIRENTGAIRFYERNGFVPDGLASRTGPAWGDLDMFRMVRRQVG